MRPVLTVLTLALALGAAGPALAQTAPPAQPSGGGTPEQMPFSTPYGTSITADRAVHVAGAVLAEAGKHPSWQFAITVVDTAGNLVYFYRMPNTQIASIRISQGKAITAVLFRRETRTFYNAYETGHAYVSTLDPGLVASPGGFPLIENGKIIGAVGCSGGTGDMDATVCAAGAASIK